LRRLVLNVILSAESDLFLAFGLPVLQRLSALDPAFLLVFGLRHLELMHFLHACLTLELGLSNELNFLFVVVTFDRTRTGIGGERSKSRCFGRECVILALALHFKSTH